MFGNFRNDERSDHERYLQDELDRERRANEDRERQLDEARERTRKERQEEWDQEYRTAQSWPDALQKQAHLCRREIGAGLKADKELGLAPDEPDTYFQDMAEANDAAFEIWKTVTTNKADEFVKLQEAIDAFWAGVRNEVADQLIAKNDKWKGTAQSIRDDALEGYLDW